MSPANDGLVGVIGIQVKPTAHEDPRQNVPGRGNPLAGGATYSDRKIYFAHG
jgi:hypothetical protein